MTNSECFEITEAQKTTLRTGAEICLKSNPCIVDCGEHSSRSEVAQFDGGKRVLATVAAIADAVRWAEEILNDEPPDWGQ